MTRHLAVLLLLASTWLGGCGGDDTVNPTNPEAGPPKSGDAAADHDAAKADAASDGAKSTTDGASEGATDHDASSDATEHDASSEGAGGD